MKKTLALLLVASLLLAGCTELTSSDDDDETKTIEIDEKIALEKFKDFITVDEDETFGVTVMYDMDPSMMDDGGMLEFDEDSDAMMTIEMTEAWSPDGFHSSMVMGLTENGATIKMTQTYTHIGTTIYTSMGYETIGDVCANEDTPEETEACEQQVGEIPATQFYRMEAANTHTEVIAAMADETAEDSDDFDVNGFLEFLEMVEKTGEFTPLDVTADGLILFSVTFDMDALEEAPSPEEALDMCDTDNSGGISWEEFIAENCDDTDSSMTSTDEGLWIGFSSADTDESEELTVDELPAFITAVTAFYEGNDEDEERAPSSNHQWYCADCNCADYRDADGDGEAPDGYSQCTGNNPQLPDMKVAFNTAGEIEYFDMGMSGMDMKMYVLNEARVNSFLTDVDAGELVALPFELSDTMDWGDDRAPSSDHLWYCDSCNCRDYRDADGDGVAPDGYSQCTGNDNGDDNHGDASEDVFVCDDGDTIPMDWVNDGDEDCAGGEDEMDMGGSDDEFMCDDGETIPMDWVNDGEEDCMGGEDEMDMGGSDDHGDGDMVCYDMSTHTVDHTIDNEADCEAAGYMWTEDQSDDHDHGSHGDDSDEVVMYITSGMDFHFEGDMSDYKIELATCDEDYDWDTGESTKTCTTVMAVAIADAGADSDIVFHDADSTGTISVGDMIHIGETESEWNTVRLYSISADAYSDENPMLTVPGFTGLVGMLALLGAAFIRRNE